MVNNSGITSQQHNELLKALNNLTKMLGSSSKINNTTSQSKKPGGDNVARNQVKQSNDEFKKNLKLARSNEKTNWQLATGISHLNRRMKKNAQLDDERYKRYARSQSAYVKAIIDNGDTTSKRQVRAIEQIDKLINQTKSLRHLRLQGQTVGQKASEIGQLNDGISNVLSVIAGAKKRNKGKDIESFANSDLKNIVKSMSMNGVSIDGTNTEEFLNKLTKFDKKTQSKKNAIDQVTRAGANPGRLKALNAELEKIGKDRNSYIQATLGKSISSIDAFNSSLMNTVRNTARLNAANELSIRALRQFGLTSFTAGALFSTAIDSFRQYVSYLKSIASQGMGGMHIDMGWLALSMKASTDQSISLFKTNMHQVMQVGFKGFRDLFTANEDNFHKMGLFGDDAVKAFGNATKTLISMGVKPKDKNQFNKSMKQYIESTKYMAQRTSSTPEELMALDAELSSTAESISLLGRLSSEQRFLAMETIRQERNRLATLVGSNQEAQEFIKTLQKLNAQSPTKRIEGAMKVQQLMQLIGMGKDATRMSRVLTMSPTQLASSPEDAAFRSEIMLEIGRRMNAIRGTNFQNEMIVDRLFQSLGPLQEAVAQAEVTAVKAANAGSVDVNSDVAAGAAKEQEITWLPSLILKFQSLAESFIANPIVKAIFGVGALLGSIIALMKIKQLGGLVTGAKTLGKGAIEKIGGMFGKSGTGGMLSTIADKFKSPGALLSGAGDALTSPGAKKMLLKRIPILGAILGAVGASAYAMKGDWKGAGLEMASGVASTVPGIGTAVSLGLDTVNMSRDLVDRQGAVAATPPTVEDMKINEEQILQRQNKIIAQQEQQIAANKNINTSSTTQDEKESQKAILEKLAMILTEQTEDERKQNEELKSLIQELISAVKPENNGLLDAIRSSSKLSFNDLQSKRILMANK